jgi:hypothetical protein
MTTLQLRQHSTVTPLAATNSSRRGSCAAYTAWPRRVRPGTLSAAAILAVETPPACRRRSCGRGVTTGTRRGGLGGLVEQLRDAVGTLASRYERLAGGDLNAWPALGGQRG